MGYLFTVQKKPRDFSFFLGKKTKSRWCGGGEYPYVAKKAQPLLWALSVLQSRLNSKLSKVEKKIALVEQTYFLFSSDTYF